jgi:hypothetical protein
VAADVGRERCRSLERAFAPDRPLGCPALRRRQPSTCDRATEDDLPGARHRDWLRRKLS